MSIYWVLNISGFWLFQACQYAGVLNFQGYTGFTYFRNYDKIWIDDEMQLWEGSECSRIPNTTYFCIFKGYTGFGICLNMAE